MIKCGYCAIFKCGACEHETRRRIDATPFCNKCGFSLMHKHPGFHRAKEGCRYNRPARPRKKDRTPGVDWRRKK